MALNLAPTPNTPTRAEAIELMDCAISNAKAMNTPITLDFDEADFILSALTAPIEQVEGLDVQTSYSCGCVTCVCNTEDRCLGCGAKSCKGFTKDETCLCRPVRQISAAPPVTAPIEKVDGWLPIETAPEGKDILVYCQETGECFVVFWALQVDTRKGDCASQ